MPYHKKVFLVSKLRFELTNTVLETAVLPLNYLLITNQTYMLQIEQNITTIYVNLFILSLYIMI